MSDHRRALAATGLAFIAVGAVTFIFGLVSRWMNVRQPIDYGIPIGAGLILAGVGLMASTRDAWWRRGRSAGGRIDDPDYP